MSAHGIISRLSPDGEDSIPLLEQYEAQLTDYKTELSALRMELLSIEDEDSMQEELATHSDMEAAIFESFHTLRRLLRNLKSIPSDAETVTVTTGTGVRLPKLAVPTFDGNILYWRQFWEQFRVSVHDRTNLSEAEKLVYLQHALKDGAAKSIIEGLSQSGEQYLEAVKCLTDRFDRPRVIHQTHVKMIIDAPPVRDGNGKELRRLHDVIQQHIRALKAMEQEPSPSFITSIIELKLDPSTMFEWQRQSQSHNSVPHYDEILAFLDARAQASEITCIKRKPDPPTSKKPWACKPINTFAANCESNKGCAACKADNHPLYSCPKFRSMPQDKKAQIVKVNNVCMNCLCKGHFANDCKSIHRCKKCQGPHHTLLHVDQQYHAITKPNPTNIEVSTNTAATKFKPSSLLMTCQIFILTRNGSRVRVRALLDGGSSASFISERLVQSLHLPRARQDVSVTGIGGASPAMAVQSITSFKISPTTISEKIIDVTALIAPKIVCDLPTSPIILDKRWSHLADLHLADPEFGTPNRVDILLGADIFAEVLLQGRRKGPPGSPIALETQFGWVLCGNTETSVAAIATCVVPIDNLLQRFWEIEESNSNVSSQRTIEELIVVHHFEENHSRKPDGRFIVPLPKKADSPSIGESRSQAVRRFLTLERSLNTKGCFNDVDAVIREYFDMGHAEEVPTKDLKKPTTAVFYLPIHAVYKQSSTTTKVRAVFDASAKSSTGTSLNDILLVGPTVHTPLIDVLLRF
jgi:hypothetical protein